MRRFRKVRFKGLFFGLLFGLAFSGMARPATVRAEGLKLNHKALTMRVHGTVKLKVKATAKRKGKVQWKSSDPLVAKVNKNGKVKAKKAGKAIITAKIKGEKATCRITVKKAGSAARTGSRLRVETQKNAQIYAAQIKEIVDATNQYRTEKGLPALKIDEKLTWIACYRSTEMAQAHQISHTRPDGSKVSALLGKYGVSYRLAGENIGRRWGKVDVCESAGIVDSWYASRPHRENMLNKKIRKIGVGIAVYTDGSGNEIYYTQLFID